MGSGFRVYRELILKWTGLEEKAGGAFGVFYGISDPGGGVVLGLVWNLGPGGGWSWVFIIMQDHTRTPPMGGGLQSFWDLARPYPPHGQYAARNTSYNWKL